MFVQQGLTRSALFNFFRRNRKNTENLDQYRRDCVHHILIRWHLGVDFEPSKETFYALEDVKKGILACANIFRCLLDVDIKMASAEASGRIQTKRRTPTPAKITFAGENTCQMRLRVQISQIYVLEQTRPTPSPRVAEREKRTFTVGYSHFVSRSSLL
jgi:hypothetical protein